MMSIVENYPKTHMVISGEYQVVGVCPLTWFGLIVLSFAFLKPLRPGIEIPGGLDLTPRPDLTPFPSGLIHTHK